MEPSKLSEVLKSLGTKAADLKAKNINEAQTKEWLIKPFFEALEWDFSNPDEVVPEEDDSSGKKPDYSFKIGGVTKFFLEAKPLSNPLSDEKMIKEKLNYCHNAGVPFLIITNGELYKVYYVELKGVGEEKRLLELNVSGDWEKEDVDMLTRDAFQQDRLLNYAKKVFIYNNVKTALEKLLQKPSKKFKNIINDSIKELLGHKFGGDEIEDALKNITVSVSMEQATDTLPQKQIPPEGWTVADQFKRGKWAESQKLYENLVQEVKNAGVVFSENTTRLYIGWLTQENKNFCQIHGQKSGLKVWVNLDMSDLTETEKLHVRDVGNVGHWGLGDIEFRLDSPQDFDWAINIIKKAYEKCSKT